MEALLRDHMRCFLIVAFLDQIIQNAPLQSWADRERISLALGKQNRSGFVPVFARA